MTTWLALLRGINVGGRNRLPMAELKRLFITAGCRQVSTYIQSGNVVFQANLDSTRTLSAAVGDSIEDEFGFRPDICLVTLADLELAIGANPYPDAANEPRTLHLSFLGAAPATTDIDRARRLLAETESCEIRGRHLYLHAPDGIGRSKFAGRAEAVLGVTMTGRNWRTVLKLQELASGVTTQS